MTFIANIVCSSVLWRGLKIRSNGEREATTEESEERTDQAGAPGQESYSQLCIINIYPLAGVCKIHPELSLFMVAEDKD